MGVTAAVIGAVGAGAQVYESGQARREAKSEQRRDQREAKALEEREKQLETSAVQSLSAKRRARRGTGSKPRETILTSPLGVTSPATTERKTLLGA